MIEQLKKKMAPSVGVNLAEFEAYGIAYRRKQDALALIKQISQLTKSIQRHRGMSMAILAGSTLFQGDFSVLQDQVERRLAVLKVFSSQSPGLISERDEESLNNAWLTIRAGWQDDAVIDNFELHSHFIEELQGMAVNLSTLLEKPVSVEVSEEFGTELKVSGNESYPKVFKLIELLNFAVRHAPGMVEQIARIRGLATYAAAKGECDYHHDRKLRYAISCARTSNEKLRQQASRLEMLLEGALPCLSLIKTYELKLMFLMNTVEMDILSGSTISANSHSLFKLATEIIDVYIKVVDEALLLLGRWHEEDVEDWVQAS